MAEELPETHCDLDTSIPDWIIDHPESLSVFREFGLDDSCGGKSLGYVCQQQGVNELFVLKRLQQILASEKESGAIE
ncbi:MAG: hypothetical protein ACK5Q5_07335 [Planctomycetaceae bacterium]